MIPEKVNELLENYRANRARLIHLRQESAELQAALDAEERQSLAAEVLHAQQYSGMPPSGVINRTVQDAAIRYADGFQSPMVRDWQADLARMQQEMQQLERCVSYVDNWLSCLESREKTILTLHQPMGDLTWPELAAQSTRLFGFHISESGLRKMAKAAKAKICSIAR